MATISGVRGVTALPSTASRFFLSPRLYMIGVCGGNRIDEMKWGGQEENVVGVLVWLNDDLICVLMLRLLSGRAGESQMDVTDNADDCFVCALRDRVAKPQARVLCIVYCLVLEQRAEGREGRSRAAPYFVLCARAIRFYAAGVRSLSVRFCECVCFDARVHASVCEL